MTADRLHKLCPERKSLGDSTADSVHLSAGQKDPYNCHNDLVCQNMLNSPGDTGLLDCNLDSIAHGEVWSECPMDRWDKSAGNRSHDPPDTGIPDTAPL